MQKITYTTSDGLPYMMTITQVAALLNISRSSAYDLAHRKGFPSMLVGSRMVVPKQRLLEWIDHQFPQK